MAPGLGDFVSKLFGGGNGSASTPREDAPLDYKGYSIVAAPRHEGGQWVVAGKIRKDGQEGAQEYDFIRADSYTSRDAAAEFTVIKAKQMIDLEGDMIFRK